jgi:hypothetical protein
MINSRNDFKIKADRRTPSVTNTQIQTENEVIIDLRLILSSVDSIEILSMY